ncbi:MAG: peroxiredoxin [Myxococcales bacterium]|jgi:peroxiredoxin Q/BCP|nr:peroxiredoxin [Myxococcales bacterium]
MAGLSVGDRAPEFTLPDETGREVSLKELREAGPVVVYFYPRDDTPGCTVEACTFRDSYEEFVGAGATVVGISADDGGSHQAFRSKHGLPFVLLTDADGSVAAAYGVKKTLGLLPGRATFVLDREGIVQSAFSSQLRVRQHVERALDVVRRLAS